MTSSLLPAIKIVCQRCSRVCQGCMITANCLSLVGSSVTIHGMHLFFSKCSQSSFEGNLHCPGLETQPSVGNSQCAVLQVDTLLSVY